ncbi:hypothetical protein LZD49_12440 [Dyadobacter sp. CY261]|uniref:hypothetical protein n=1 Tax=Dyadobacter sp. CY261 TaxID=2907203 RepID=UPI001F33777F|nr:hypothetical protein [Dyadobacter sp. CY261]MCF0071281.1 hypothetical protein [Dyadobacter sp. CY261]
MIPIELKFPDGKSKHFLVPQSFEELTEDQYLKCITILKRAETYPSDQWLLLMVLIRISQEDLKLLNGVQRIELLSTMGFLYDLDKLPSKQMIKKLHGKDRSKVIALYGPGDLLKHFTFGEFLAAETRLDRYYQIHDEAQLNQFCGVMYRKSSPERSEYSDQRTSFEDGLVESNGRYFSKVDDYTKTALVMNYNGMKRRFPSLYRNVFPPKMQDEDELEPKPKPKQRTSSSMAWLNTLVSLADRDVTKIKEVEKASLHTVLKVLDEMIQHNQQMKEEAIRNRR